MVNGISGGLFGVLVHVTKFGIYLFIDTVAKCSIRAVLVKEVFVHLFLVLHVHKNLILQGKERALGKGILIFERDNRTGKVSKALRKIAIGSSGRCIAQETLL